MDTLKLKLKHLIRIRGVSVSGLPRAEWVASAARQLGEPRLLSIPAFHAAFWEVY